MTTIHPHTFTRYNNQKAIVSIQTLEILEGELTTRLFKLVTEWAILHQVELMEDWELARDNQTLEKISPLE
nr:DUF4160 domain-containing protein [Nostoc sp. XA010]